MGKSRDPNLGLWEDGKKRVLPRFLRREGLGEDVGQVWMPQEKYWSLTQTVPALTWVFTIVWL